MNNNNFAMPSHLTGDMATQWNDLAAQAGDNPETVVKVTDPAKFASIEALSTVGGCSFEKVGNEMNVTLFFEPERTEPQPEEIRAEAKPHKFAKVQ